MKSSPPSSPWYLNRAKRGTTGWGNLRDPPFSTEILGVINPELLGNPPTERDVPFGFGNPTLGQLGPLIPRYSKFVAERLLAFDTLATKLCRTEGLEMIGLVLYLIRYGDQSGRRWVDQAIAIPADSSGTLHKPQRQSSGNVRIWEISMKRRVVMSNVMIFRSFSKPTGHVKYFVPNRKYIYQ